MRQSGGLQKSVLFTALLLPFSSTLLLARTQKKLRNNTPEVQITTKEWQNFHCIAPLLLLYLFAFELKKHLHFYCVASVLLLQHFSARLPYLPCNLFICLSLRCCFLLPCLAQTISFLYVNEIFYIAQHSNFDFLFDCLISGCAPVFGVAQRLCPEVRLDVRCCTFAFIYSLAPQIYIMTMQ